MSIEKSIEEKIQQGIAAGEFDNLKGAGKPLNLDDYFTTPEDVRMGFSILKSNDFVPEEVEILKEISRLREKIKSGTKPEEKQKLTKTLNEKSLALTIFIDAVSFLFSAVLIWQIRVPENVRTACVSGRTKVNNE